MTTSKKLVFATSLIGIAAASQLCQDTSNYDSTAIASQLCYTNTYADLDAAETDCDVSDLCNAFESGSVYYCWCSTDDLTIDCPLTDPTYAAQTSCADRADSWDYSDSDAETQCDDAAGDMAQYAYNCCNGENSICEDYTSELCSGGEDDYNPLADNQVWCYEILDVDNLVDAAAACDSSCYSGYQDLTGDGVSEYYCFCFTTDVDTGCVLSDPYLTGENNCAESAYEWDYNDEDYMNDDAEEIDGYSAVQTACTVYYDDYASWADNCCTSEESVCAGYCYSADSTVTSLVGEASETSETVPISQLKQGDMILALNSDKQSPTFSKVNYISKSKSDGQFYEIEMKDHNDMEEKTEKIRATPHHTFPTCNKHEQKFVAAAHIKQGDCLMTTNGEKHVKRVTKQDATEGDYTYSLRVEDAETVFVGGIATHSLVGTKAAAASSASASLTKHANKFEKAASASKKLRGASGAAAAGAFKIKAPQGMKTMKKVRNTMIASASTSASKQVSKAPSNAVHKKLEKNKKLKKEDPNSFVNMIQSKQAKEVKAKAKMINALMKKI